MECVIDNDIVPIVIIRKNNKNIYLRFKEDKKLYVTCNNFTTQREILKIIDNNRLKLTKMYKSVIKNEEENRYFNYLGHKYIICYKEDCIEPIMDTDIIYVKNYKYLEKFYKSEVERVFKEEVEKILPYFKNIPQFKLVYRKMKTRWGVNNLKSKTITLNTELLKKDIELLDYVIVHELCHFYEANHSKNFWNYVAKYYPNYKEARKRLRG